MTRIDERWLLCIFLSTFFVVEIWTLLPDSKLLIQPFPFTDVSITWQAFIWIACLKIVAICIAFILCQYSTGAKFFFEVVFFLACAEFLEYFLCYNKPWFLIQSIPINITTIRYAVLFVTLIYTLKKWRT